MTTSADRRWTGTVLGLLAAAGSLAPLAPAWLAGLTHAYRDTKYLYAPVRGVVGEALRDGRLPLWNPWVATGTPLFAEAVHGVLHPVSLACAVLFPGDGIDPLLGAYVVTAAVGTTVLARRLGAGGGASLLAAFAYALSGFTLSMTANLVFLAGAASAPWIVAGLHEAARAPAARGFVLGALAVACGALAGDVQGLSAAAALGLAVAAAVGGRPGLARAAASVSAGGLLAAIQLVPSWRHLALTVRSLELPAEERVQWALAPLRLVELVAPGLFIRAEDGLVAPVFLAHGDPAGLQAPFAWSVYVGAPVVVLAGVGLRDRLGKVLGGAAAVLVWLALGHHLGARAFVSALPVASGFRYAEKWIGPLTLVLALLAARGADEATADAAGSRRVRLGALAALGAALLAWAAPTIAPAGLEGSAGLLRARLADGLGYAVAGCAVVVVAVELARRGWRRGATALLVAGVLAGAIAAAPHALRPGRPDARTAVAPPSLAAPPPGPRVVSFAAFAAAGGADAVDRENFVAAALLMPDDNVRARIDSIGVFTGFEPLGHARLSAALGPAWPRAARRYALTHVLTQVPAAGDPYLGPIVAGGTLAGLDRRIVAEAWAVPHRPWAVFPDAILAASGPDDAIEQVVRLYHAGDRAAVVEADAAPPTAPGRVLEIARTAEAIRVVAEAERDATLVVNDAFWPGWRADVDGRPVPIYRADALVRAVPWPAGRHVLEMRYAPEDVAVAGWLSLAGIAVVAAAAFALRRRSRGGA